VVSRSLPEVTTTRTRLSREPSAGDICKLKAESAKNISVAGPTLAASDLKPGLIDEVSTSSTPVVVGGGTPMFQDIDATVRLEWLAERAFENGVTFVRSAVRKCA
jgi:dihydrofolate reductase